MCVLLANRRVFDILLHFQVRKILLNKEHLYFFRKLLLLEDQNKSRKFRFQVEVDWFDILPFFIQVLKFFT